MSLSYEWSCDRHSLHKVTASEQRTLCGAHSYQVWTLNGVHCFARPVLGFILSSSLFPDLFWDQDEHQYMCPVSPYLPCEAPSSVLVMAHLQRPRLVFGNPPPLVTAPFFSSMPLAPSVVWVFSTCEWCIFPHFLICPFWLLSVLCYQSHPCPCIISSFHVNNLLTPILRLWLPSVALVLHFSLPFRLFICGPARSYLPVNRTHHLLS